MEDMYSATETTQFINEYQQLLRELKCIVESLLISRVPNVWNVYGGLNRLHSAIENIFKHHCKLYNGEGKIDCWGFVQGLNWLQPDITNSTLSIDSEFQPHLPTHLKTDKVSLWLYRNLENHCLSQKLSWLLSDKEHLLSSYEQIAFMCQEKYTEATLICLRAVERNEPSLLSEVDPCLFLNKTKHYHKAHRRCSSFPDSTIFKNKRIIHCKNVELVEKRMKRIYGKLNPWNSLPNLRLEIVKNKKRSFTTPSSPNKQIKEKLSTNLLKVDYLNSTQKNICKNALRINKMIHASTVYKNCDKTVELLEKQIKNINSRLKPWKSLPNLQLEIDKNRRKSVTNPPSPITQKNIKKISQSDLKVDFTLSEIDSCLFSNKTKHYKKHTRCLSFPDSFAFKNNKISDNVIDKWNSLPNLHLKKIETNKQIDFNVLKIDFSKFVGKKWKSLPNLQFKNSRNKKSSFVTTFSPKRPKSINEKLSPSVLKVDYSTSIRRKLTRKENSSKKHKKVDENLSRKKINNNFSKIENMSVVSTKSLPCTHYKLEKLNLALDLVKSAPEYTFPILPGEKDFSKRPPKSFIEDGGSSVLPMFTGFFPRPCKGQTLTSFLSSGQFSRANAELDRENAHFCVSEAMIAVIEEIKWKKGFKLQEERIVESDEEINTLKQRIRFRRREKWLEKQRRLWSASLLSDGRTDTTTEASTSPLSTTPDSASESLSSDSVDDLEIDEASNLTEQKGLSMSMASLYSEGDLMKKPRGAPDGQSDILSAEGVALSLISKFNEKQLPRASELEWLVSEQDAPQKLLPLPKSWPVSPVEYTPLRGTTEWAPPRPQIIFTVHPHPVRKILIAKQNYRCAGCGMKVAPQYASKFRYCDYLGRFFCTGCHTNQLAMIPGRVLQKWDFSRYPVSSFSYRLLEQMFNDPLFRVIELNPNLLRKSKNLEKSHKLRLQLFHLKDFILTCRFAELEQESMEKESAYILTDPEVYSLNDLIQIKNGEFIIRIKNLVDFSIKHVSNCQLCNARGFLCEICNNIETIFPWQLDRITRCEKCGSCFHIACRNKCESCPKCSRISDRQKNAA